MEYKNLAAGIEELTNRELQNAQEKFPPFNSSHEGYAVILEELEELLEEIRDFQSHLGGLWNATRKNDPVAQGEEIQLMALISGRIVKEGIQLTAMCNRFKQDLVDE